MLTLLTTLKTLNSQQRNILEFITHAIVAARENKEAPSLLSKISTSSAQKEFLIAA